MEGSTAALICRFGATISAKMAKLVEVERCLARGDGRRQAARAERETTRGGAVTLRLHCAEACSLQFKRKL